MKLQIPAEFKVGEVKRRIKRLAELAGWTAIRWYVYDELLSCTQAGPARYSDEWTRIQYGKRVKPKELAKRPRQWKQKAVELIGAVRSSKYWKLKKVRAYAAFMVHLDRVFARIAIDQAIVDHFHNTLLGQKAAPSSAKLKQKRFDWMTRH